MDLGVATLLIGGVIGLALALFGAKLLTTGQAPAPTARAFRTITDAGWYHVLFGAALVILVVGAELPSPIFPIASAVVAVGLAAVAVVRYRPRRKSNTHEPENTPEAESTSEGSSNTRNTTIPRGPST
jgi:hypothetical protein